MKLGLIQIGNLSVIGRIGQHQLVRKNCNQSVLFKEFVEFSRYHRLGLLLITLLQMGKSSSLTGSFFTRFAVTGMLNKATGMSICHYILAAYRSTHHPATGFTPNRLMFGRELLHHCSDKIICATMFLRLAIIAEVLLQ